MEEDLRKMIGNWQILNSPLNAKNSLISAKNAVFPLFCILVNRPMEAKAPSLPSGSGYAILIQFIEHKFSAARRLFSYTTAY